MTYDGFTLAAVVAELRRTILRGRVQKVRQHNETDVTLEVHGVGHTYLLFFSVDARFPRVYLTASSPSVQVGIPGRIEKTSIPGRIERTSLFLQVSPPGGIPKEPPNFCMLLRKYAQGAFVSKIDQVGMDRIVHFHLEYPDGTTLVLILEIMGKHSNLILVNAEGKILGAAKHVGSSISRYRQVLPGREYMPPPGVDKIDPRALDAASFDKLWNASPHDLAVPKNARSWLIETFSGFGPFLADEIVARVNEGESVPREKLRSELTRLAEMVEKSEYAPVFVTGERGEGLMVYPMPSVQFPSDRQHSRVSINESLDALFRSLVGRSTLEDERAQALTAIRRSEAARRQTLKSIERTLAESERADRYKQIGELLIGSLGAIEKGATSVRLVDYFDPDMPEVEVDLDEKLSPQQNAERYFKRYRKARDAAHTSESRKAHLLRELDILDAARREVESAASVEAVRDLRKMLVDRDVLRAEVTREKPEGRRVGESESRERIGRVMTPEGWEILYGESATANDYLTQRVARPNDVWLHARSITGAHVIVRTAGHSGNVPRPVLLRASAIAALNSDAKHSSVVPVDHTLRKFVRKPRGAAPGFVTYRNEKTIDIEPKGVEG